MPRILHFLSGLNIGGKERAALRLAHRLTEEGEDARLFLFDTPFRDLARDFDPYPVPITFLKRGGGVDIRFAWRLANLLRREKIDVIHAHNDTALFYASLAALLCVRSRPRVMGTFHTWPSHGGFIARLLTRIAACNATVVAVSEELTGRLLRSGWLGRCDTLWNGVQTDHFKPEGPDGGWRENLGAAPSDILVGLVARFDPIKRHEDLLAAATLLRGDEPRLLFVLVGQGPTLPDIERRAAGRPEFRFVSHVQDMPPLLRALDIFVLCSAHEAAPLVLLEAMACGVPVVASAVGGIPHILGHGRSSPDDTAGVLVPPFDPQRLATAIRRLASDKTERQRMGAAARMRALRFSFENEWRSYAALYGEKRPRCTPASPP